jgi:hypothetical protein
MALLLGACDMNAPEAERPNRSGETQTISQALHCIQWDSKGCLRYAPDAPPGFFDCAGDTNAYPGEIVIFDRDRYQGYCFYHGVTPGTSFGAPYLNDMDHPYPDEHYVRSYKTNMTRWGAIYDGSSYNGVWYSTAPVENREYWYNFDVSSLIMAN